MKQEKNEQPLKVKQSHQQSFLERMFEHALWNTRFFVIFAVICGLASSLALFIIGSVDIVNVFIYIVNTYTSGLHPDNFHAKIVGDIIESVDIYLIAIVLFIFGYGVYELFISYVDVAKASDHSKVLEIHSLDDLKDKITKVIIMVLIVTFFKKVLSMSYQTPYEMLTLAASIFGLSLGLYFLHKNKH